MNDKGSVNSVSDIQDKSTKNNNNMYYPVQLGEASNKIYLCQCDQMDPRFGVFR